MNLPSIPASAPKCYITEVPSDVLDILTSQLKPQDLSAFARTSKKIKFHVDKELYFYKFNWVVLLRDMLCEVRGYTYTRDIESLKIINKINEALNNKELFAKSFNISLPTGIWGLCHQGLKQLGWVDAPLIEQADYQIKRLSNALNPSNQRNLHLITTSAPYNRFLEFSRNKLTSMHPSFARHICGNTYIDRRCLSTALLVNSTHLHLFRGLFDNVELYPDLLEFAEKSKETFWIQICGNITSHLPLPNNIVSVLKKFESLKYFTLSNFSMNEENIETLKNLFEISLTNRHFVLITIKDCEITSSVENYLKKVSAEGTFPQLCILDQSKDKNFMTPPSI